MNALYTNRLSEHDHYLTPFHIWEKIAHLLPRDREVWEPFYAEGSSGAHLERLGFRVRHDPLEDFFQHNHGDIIVSNPPFSKKREVLERLYTIGKPFVLILPASSLATQYAIDLFGDELQIIVPRRRMCFHKASEDMQEVLEPMPRSPFNCFYFCWRMGLPRDLIFV